MSFFSRKPELGLVFHIGTSSVGAGIVAFERGSLPIVLSTIRESIPYTENVDPRRFFADMIQALKHANLRISKECPGRIKHVFYVFSSPWAVTQTKVISIQEDKDFVVTKDRIDRLMETHEKMFESEMGTGGADAHYGLKVIEKRVIQIKLNGYEIPEPFGKKARTAEISLFLSLIPEVVLDSVFESSARTFHPKDTKASSFSLASFSVIRDVFHGQTDFIFLDIGGEICDVTVVKGGLILETASFPFGSHFIVREIKKAVGGTADEAVSLIKLFEDGTVDPAVREKLSGAMKDAATAWRNAFHTALASISQKTSLPVDLFVIINGELVQFFMRALRDEKISEFGVAEAPLSVTLVSQDKLKGSVSWSKKADKDAFIALIAAFAGRVYGSKEK